ncbi:hypothetical protein EV424DRAFT_1352104 [Suillus variegatus]|nr:hypothetical protein EV424DRAFT_1352104 [Suillus variegatus]
MLGEYGIVDQGLGIQNSVKSQVTSSESRVPNPGSRVPNFGVRGSATRSSATVLGVRVLGALEIAFGLGIENSVVSQVTSSESRVPNPGSRVTNFGGRGSATQSSATAGFAELRVAEPRTPKFGTRDPGFGTRDSELVTWDLTLF